jgi:hypothetical protein
MSRSGRAGPASLGRSPVADAQVSRRPQEMSATTKRCSSGSRLLASEPGEKRGRNAVCFCSSVMLLVTSSGRSQPVPLHRRRNVTLTTTSALSGAAHHTTHGKLTWRDAVSSPCSWTSLRASVHQSTVCAMANQGVRECSERAGDDGVACRCMMSSDGWATSMRP